MYTSEPRLGAPDLPGQKGDHRRAVAVCALTLGIICWVKLTSWFGLGPVTILIPLCAAFVALACLSPPVAAALFFFGNFFFGNLSIAFYPRISFLTIIAAVLIAALLAVRWRRHELSRLARLSGQIRLAVAGLALFFLIGYARAVWQWHFIELDSGHSRPLISLFQASLRDNGGWALYMLFLTHWLSFVTIGVLACLSPGDLKTFFLACSILFLVQLLAIPLAFYPDFFRGIYVECQARGLEYAQVNRAYLGYMAAFSGGLALTMAHERNAWLGRILPAWWIVLSLIVVLSGSKGPVFAWILVTAMVIWLRRREGRVVYGTLMRMLLVVGASSVLISGVTGYSVMPCGLSEKFQESRYSVEARLAQTRDMLSPYLHLAPNEIIRLPDGETRSVGAMDALRYRVGETEALHEGEPVGIGPGYSSGGIYTWLFGNGFGSSIYTVDPQRKILRIHSGSLNILIDIFIETGLIGLSVFVASVMALWINFWKSTGRLTPDHRGLFRAGMSSAGIVLLVKTGIAADTPTEDLAALVTGLLIAATAVYSSAVSISENNVS